MRQMSWVAKLLWVATSAACGRIGFDEPPLEIESTPFESRCGQAPTAVMLQVTNTSDVDASVDATATGGFTVETALPLSIAAGDSGFLAVRPPAAVVGTDIPGTYKYGTLTVSVGDNVQELDLKSTVVGASLEMQSATGGPLALDLVGSQGLCPAPVAAKLVNTGNETASIVFMPSARVALDGAMDGELAPGASTTFTLRPVTASSCAGTFDLGYDATGAVCDAMPVVLPGTFTINGSSSCSCS